MSCDYRWCNATKAPGDTLPVELDLFGLCANFWTHNEPVDLGNFMWPVIADANGEISGNGFVYECTQAGRTGSKQPKWNLVADQVLAKLDGSAQWTCRNSPFAGLNAVTLTSSVSSDAALTVAGAVVSENTKLLVDYAGGDEDVDYEVTFSFVIAGRARVGTQVIEVRKK